MTLLVISSTVAGALVVGNMSYFLNIITMNGDHYIHIMYTLYTLFKWACKSQIIY